MDFRVRHAQRLISEDLRRPLVLEEVARAVNLSTPHLRSLFRAETSMTPAQYLKSLRMQKARDLLEKTFLNVKQIMFQVGIIDKSHFARLPSEIRTFACGISKESAGIKRYAPLAAAPLLCLPLVALAQGSKSADEVAIRRVVRLYIDGWNNNDAESLRQSLHPKGKWFFPSYTRDLKEVRQGRGGLCAGVVHSSNLSCLCRRI